MLKLNENEKLKLIFLSFSIFYTSNHKNLAPNRYGLVKLAKPY